MFTHLVTLVDTLPSVSETFIDREVAALRDVGTPVAVYALHGDATHRLRSRAAARLRLHILRAEHRRPRRCLALLRRAGQVAELAAHLRALPAPHLMAQFAWITADIARLAARLAGIPFSVRAHAWDVFTQSPARLRQCLNAATAVLPCNAAAARTIVACGIPAQRVAMVRHGLPLRAAEWDWRPPRAVPHVLGVGRLIPKKGVDVLLEACGLLARAAVPFALEWIGDGPLRGALQRRVAALGLQREVVFAGALAPAAVRARMRSSGLLALPSRRLPNGDRDGIANVLLEAMALGLPVVSTTAGGAAEALTDGVHGMLVPPDDAPALATALARLLSSGAQRTALARAARERVAQEFDAHRNAVALLDALRTIGDSPIV